MATRMHCTDLVLLWHEHRPDPWATYIYTALPLYIDPHTTSFVNHTQYLVPRWHVLWQYVVSSLTPLVGPRFQSSVPKLRSKATLPQARFLPSFHVNADPVKSLHDKSIWTPKPMYHTASRPEFPSRLQVLLPAGYVLVSWLQLSQPRLS